MDNPFLKRATEQYRKDNEAFLSVVSPEPLTNFLGTYARDGQLYDRLIVIQGTPGSGKTTLARVFEYQTVAALLRNPTPFRPLLHALVTCGAVADDHLPRLLGCRLSLESDYRDFWEFPYSNDVKCRLMEGLIQARAIQSWLGGLLHAGVDTGQIAILLKDEAKAASQTIGGTDVNAVIDRAEAIELALYQVVAAMVPPSLSELGEIISEVYRPFDIIEKFRVSFEVDGQPVTRALTPLVVLDDAHVLHPKQFDLMRHWLMGRELRIARWVMTRLDILDPQDSLALATQDRTQTPDLPGVTSQRDVIEIPMQSGRGKGSTQRNTFRRIARDMADRYLTQMTFFSRSGHKSFSSLLISDHKTPIAKSKLEDLETSLDAAQARIRISDEVRSKLSGQVKAYRPEGKVITRDIELQMLSILMHRYEKRSPQMNLFDDEVIPDDDTVRLPAAKSAVYEAACVQLYHRYGRPLYYGIDDLCDASSENAEQFLRLAAALVDAMAVRITRSKSPVLEPATQHNLLVEEASHVVSKWDFPSHRRIRTLVDGIADRCKVETLKPNAGIGSGASAYGIPQVEFTEVTEKYSDLAGLLHYAVAYNAVSLVPDYLCKNKQWCLIELGGHTLLRHGLTLRRGGFIEGTLSELAALAAESRE